MAEPAGTARHKLPRISGLLESSKIALARTRARTYSIADLDSTRKDATMLVHGAPTHQITVSIPVIRIAVITITGTVAIAGVGEAAQKAMTTEVAAGARLDAPEVVAGGGEDGVSGIAGAAFEIAAPEVTFGLEVTDHGLDHLSAGRQLAEATGADQRRNGVEFTTGASITKPLSDHLGRKGLIIWDMWLQIVFIDKGEGRFEPREVKVGTHGENFTEIRNGVHEGDRVVVAANFLIDAESNLKSALQAFTDGETAK